MISTRGGTPGLRIGLQPGDVRTSIRQPTRRAVTRGRPSRDRQRTEQRAATRVEVGQAVRQPRQVELQATRTPVSQARSAQLEASVFGRGVARASALTPTVQQRLAPGRARVSPRQPSRVTTIQQPGLFPTTIGQRLAAPAPSRVIPPPISPFNIPGQFERATEFVAERTTRQVFPSREQLVERARGERTFTDVIISRLRGRPRERVQAFRGQTELIGQESIQFVRERPLTVAATVAGGGLFTAISRTGIGTTRAFRIGATIGTAGFVAERGIAIGTAQPGRPRAAEIAKTGIEVGAFALGIFLNLVISVLNLD